MKHLRGFTLIEMIIVIVLTGIVGGMVATITAGQVSGYVATVRRAGLTDMADLALKRMTLEIRNSVPNSIPQLTNSSFVQFLPTRGGGRYCSDSAPDTCTNPLTDFDPLDASATAITFDVLGAMPAASVGDHVVIYNTGQTGLDAYNNDNCRQITAVGASTLQYNAKAFPYASPSNRFFVAPSSGPVRFSCTATQVQRINGAAAFCGQTPTATTTTLAAADSVNCQFSYTQVSAANGLLTLSLTLTNSGESITLMRQLHVSNLP